MKDRYVVININERDEFEKTYQLPYGYGNSPIKPTTNPQEAIDCLKKLDGYKNDLNDWIVERISDFGRELYYRL